MHCPLLEPIQGRRIRHWQHQRISTGELRCSAFPVSVPLPCSTTSRHALCELRRAHFADLEVQVQVVVARLQVRQIGTSRIIKTLNNAAGPKSIITMQWSTIDENIVYVGTTGHTVYELNVAESVEDCGVEVSLSEKPKSERSTCEISTAFYDNMVDRLGVQRVSERLSKNVSSIITASGSKSKSSKNRSLFPCSSNADNLPKSEGLEDLLLFQRCVRLKFDS